MSPDRPQPPLRLIGPPGGSLPALAEWEDRRVEWSAWEESPWNLCAASRIPCGHCGADAPSWTSIGTVHPLPGETVQGERPSRRVPGAFVSGRVPAWPLRRLVAYRCMSCRAMDVFDRGPDGTTWSAIPVQGSLLDFLESDT